jgi:Bacterial pre-peptidase C-terminal domain
MMVTTGTLVDADTTSDYYSFTGTKGERITAAVTAQGLVMGSPQGDDSSIIDAVITIYDASKKQIAQDDDPWPRTGRDPQVFTVLPADGTYYLVVNDCNTAFPFGGCSPANLVFTFDYTLFVADVDQLTSPEANQGAEPNDTANAMSPQIGYVLPPMALPGQYGLYTVDGDFASAADVDVFSFTPPVDTAVSAGQRAHAEFWFQPVGTNNGDGSTSNAKAWIVDSADVTKHLSEIDQSNYSDGDNPNNGPADLTFPVVLNHQYYLFVQHQSLVSKPTSDFYFARHFVGSFSYGQLEASPDNNNSLATAEKLFTPGMVTPGNFFVDGNISSPGMNGDIDYYTMDVPAGLTQALLFCDAQRQGSGLRNAKFELLNVMGNPLGPSNILSELPNMEVYLGGISPVTLPANTTKILLRVSAGSQDPNVTGTFYRCSIFLQ